MSSARVRILGVNFYDGTALTAVEKVNSSGGCVVILASPALTKLNYDEAYRAALQQADVVLPDSELLILLWRLATGRQLQKNLGYRLPYCPAGNSIVPRRSKCAVGSSF
jgi:UDP-N-acetyl-D-mannosaminuronic acid transferase (WecB/TagA/CpsF family)